MAAQEYHLFYVLSEPPVPVAKRRLHRWSSGDVVAAPKHSALQSERFVVLDSDADGRMLALRVAQLSHKLGQASDDFLWVRQDAEEWESVGSPTETSRYICFDKIYYEAAIIGTGGRVEDVLVMDSLSPELMTLVISKFTTKFGEVLKLPFGHGASDNLSGDTTMDLGNGESVKTDGKFDQLMAYAFQLPRFLNIAYTAFDDTDYAAIREFLKLPSKCIGAQNNLLDCGCNDHRRKVRRASDPCTTTASVWRTYDKMCLCAERLNLNLTPASILSQLNDLSYAFRCHPREQIMHTFKAKPCYILDLLPHELLLSIVECFDRNWDREEIYNLGLTCTLFHQIIIVYRFRSIGISCKPNVWDKMAHLLPKYGHLTRDIYLEHYQTEANRNCYQNLRAIGDFCPNLERLDLNYPVRMDLNATEADLGPKISVEGEEDEIESIPNEEEENLNDEMMDIGAQTLQGLSIINAMQVDGVGNVIWQSFDGAAPVASYGGAGAQAPDPNAAITNDGAAQAIGGIVPVVNDGDGNGDGVNGDDNDDPGAGNANAANDGDGVIVDPAEQAALDAAAQAAQAQLARVTAIQSRREAAALAERRLSAELDYILKQCPRIDHFSMQWTAKLPLERYYHRIRNLKAIRIWDSIDEATLVNTGKACRNLKRFYLEGQDSYLLSPDSIIKFLGALNTKEKSCLRRLGIYTPLMRWHLLPGQHNLQDDEEDFDDEGEDVLDEDDMDDVDGDDGAVDADGNPIAPAAVEAQIPPVPQVDVRAVPIGRFLDTLSTKHPFLERLSLHNMHIMDELMPLFGSFLNLTALDLSFPKNRGLSAVGIHELVSAFRDKSLSALDVSGHTQISDDDINTITGSDGLSSMRFVRMRACPLLAGRYLVDEWVHPDDLICEDATWRPKNGKGLNMLEIGDGWKEQWDPEYH